MTSVHKASDNIINMFMFLDFTFYEEKVIIWNI